MGSDPLRTLRLLILLGSTGDGSAADFLLASRLTTPVWENNPTHTRSTRRRSLRVQIPIGPPVSHRDVRGPSGSALKGPIPVDIVLSFIAIWVLVQKHKAQ